MFLFVLTFRKLKHNAVWYCIQKHYEKPDKARIRIYSNEVATMSPRVTKSLRISCSM